MNELLLGAIKNKKVLAAASAAVAAPLLFIPIHGDHEAKVDADAKTKRRLTQIKKTLKTHGVYAGTTHKRIVVPKNKLSEISIKRLGFVPSAIAVPEAGQDRFTSFRHPYNNYHIHSHKDVWTVHEDAHPSSQMIALKSRTIAGKSTALIKGLPHLIGEGVPGLASYTKGVGKKMSTAKNVIENDIAHAMKKIHRWKDDITHVKESSYQYGFIDELTKIASRY